MGTKTKPDVTHNFPCRSGHYRYQKRGHTEGRHLYVPNIVRRLHQFVGNRGLFGGTLDI